MDKSTLIKRPEIDDNIESNMRNYINYLRNNTEEVIINAETKYWTETCIQSGVTPFLIESTVDRNVISVLSDKDFFASMTEEQIEEYIAKEMKRAEEFEQHQNGKKTISQISKEKLKEIKLRHSLYASREAQYMRQKDAVAIEDNNKKTRH